MSKYDIGVGEAFELDESQAQDDTPCHHGRRHRHHHRHHHHHDHGHHDHDFHREHFRAHMAALAVMFRLHRRSMRAPFDE